MTLLRARPSVRTTLICNCREQSEVCEQILTRGAVPDLSDAIWASCRDVSHWTAMHSSCNRQTRIWVSAMFQAVQGDQFLAFIPGIKTCTGVLCCRDVRYTSSFWMACRSANSNPDARSPLKPPAGSTSGTEVAAVMTR